jgi:hypothetical protein
MTDCSIFKKLKKNKEFMLVYFGPKEHDLYNKIYLPYMEETLADKTGKMKRVFFRHNNDATCANEYFAIE